MGTTDSTQNLRGLVATVAAAYFSNSSVQPNQVRSVICDIAGALLSAVEPTSTDAPRDEPLPKDSPGPSTGRADAVITDIASSITPAGLISFEDGRAYKTLRRHLKRIGLTETEYRAKWGLPEDYPMVSPDYSRARSAVAKSIGLSQHGASARRRSASQLKSRHASKGRG
jgi:predicted transcriptional regulator